MGNQIFGSKYEMIHFTSYPNFSIGTIWKSFFSKKIPVSSLSNGGVCMRMDLISNFNSTGQILNVLRFVTLVLRNIIHCSFDLLWGIRMFWRTKLTKPGSTWLESDSIYPTQLLFYYGINKEKRQVHLNLF